MKKTTNNPIKILVATMLLCFGVYDTYAQKTSFSGTWRRNDQQSDAGGLSINSISTSLQITQDKGSITIKGTNKNGHGDVSTYVDILKLDGSQSERTTNTGQKKQMSLTWSADKERLIQSSTYKDEQGNVTNRIKQTYSLSDDGRILTVSDERSFDGQTYQLKDVFDKQ